MADRRSRRRTAPARTLIGPLAMLLGGVGAGAVLWHVLMRDPEPSGPATEQLTRHDQQLLERLLDGRRGQQ